MNRQHVVCSVLALLIGLALPGPGAALTKQEIRERSLKRLERVSEKVKGAPDGQDLSGINLGRPIPVANDPAAPQPGRGHPVPDPAQAGRAAERRTDAAVILAQPHPTSWSAPSDPSGPSGPSGPDPHAHPAHPAQDAPVAPPPQTSPGHVGTLPATAAVIAPASAPTAPPLAAPQPTVSPADRSKALDLFQKALAAAKKDNHKKALGFLDKAAALNPTDPDIFNNRGNAHNNLGNLEKALADYDMAVSLRPADAASLSNRGLAFERLGNDAAACRDYRAACDLGDCEFFESFAKEGRCPK